MEIKNNFVHFTPENELELQRKVWGKTYNPLEVLNGKLYYQIALQLCMVQELKI